MWGPAPREDAGGGDAQGNLELSEPRKVTTSCASLMVLTGEHFACVKVTGRATFTLAIDFKALLTRLEARGYPYLVIELADCSLMDSTFLGVLAASAARLNPVNAECETRAIELRNANTRLLDLLESLGVLHLFKLGHEPVPDQGYQKAVPMDACQQSRENLIQASLEAHETLMQINPDNVERFKEVTRFLKEDLKKSKNSRNRGEA